MADTLLEANQAAHQAGRLIRRFTRYEDMILRFAVDLTVPFTNYAPNERSGQSRCNNAPPAALGALSKDSSTSWLPPALAPAE